LGGVLPQIIAPLSNRNFCQSKKSERELNILLVYPWYPYSSVTTYEEPLGVLYLAAVLIKAGYRVKVADLTFARKLDGLETMARWADMVGISAPTPLVGTAAAVLRFIRKSNPDIRGVIGGPHATAAPDDVLNHGFDLAVIGEGELTLVDLVETFGRGGSLEGVPGIAYRTQDGLHFTEPRPFINDLDAIPLPAREFIDYSRYRRLGIISMRGCPYRCLYCKPVEEKLFGKKLRKRSLESVVEEIDMLMTTYGNRPISIKDDTLTVNNTAWFEGLGEQLQRCKHRVSWQCSSRVDTVNFNKLKAMKKAGCRQIFFGIESGSQKILDYYHKDLKVEQIVKAFAMCNRVGIRSCASIMLGAPIETRQDLEKTYQLVKSIKPFNWQVHVTTPMRGSYLYDRARAEKRLASKTDYSAFEPTGNIYRLTLPMQLDNLTEEDIAEYRDRINKLMKFRLLLNCLIDPSLWKELILSRGMRTIAFNFLRRHFNLFHRRRSHQSNLPSADRMH
jgi:radical SAM superfamily enzyme YgiQ (UPF0313 family)